jgi:sugar diacid utilization regulator
MTKPKAIIAPNTKEKPSAESSLEQAAKIASDKKKRQAAQTKRKQQAIKEGDSGFILVPFYYADGRTAAIRVNAATQRLMLIDKQKDGDVKAEGDTVSGYKQNDTKQIQVSFGRAKKTVKSGKYKGKTRLVQAYKALSVPKNATKLDILFWIKSFGKKPGLVRIGQETFVLDSKRARASAGAIR